MGRAKVDFGSVTIAVLAGFIVFGLAGCAEALASSAWIVDQSPASPIQYRLGDVTIPLSVLVFALKWKPTVVVEHRASPESVAEWRAIAELTGPRK